MGKGKKVTTGYRYYLGMQFGLAHAIDALTEVLVDLKVAWSGNQTTSGSIQINAPNILGGDKYEGGVVGQLDVMMGEPTQAPNDYLASRLPGTQPAYRNSATAVWRRGQTGSNSRSPRPWSFRVRRALAGWDGAVWHPELAVIPLGGGAVQAMNPAHIIYESITNRFWGMGLDRGVIDETSFTAAATTFFEEGMGLCIKYDQQSSIQDWIQTICDHAACGLVLDPSTGLFTLLPIRFDYDPTTIPVLADADLVELISFEIGTPVGATNELALSWHDPTTNTDRSVTLQALGNVQAQGGVVPASKSLPGIATADLAARVCQRELGPVSVPLSKLQARFKRTARKLIPCKVFSWSYAPLGIVNMVMRVGEYDGGTLTDGAITLTCVQDVFSMPTGVYVQEQPSGWVPSDPTPTPSPLRLLMEATYRDLAQVLGASAAQALSTTAAYVALCAERPSGAAKYYELWTAIGSGAYSQASSDGDWCATGSLLAPLNPGDTSITVVGGVDLIVVETGTAAIIENEIVRIDAFDPTTGIGTIARGCIDTTPALQHPAGARIWFYDNDATADPSQYLSGETIDAAALTVTSLGYLPLPAAPVDTLTMIGRAAKPYPPGNLEINGQRYPAVAHQPLAITWSHRDRLLQSDQLIDTLQSDIGPEPGTTYTVNVYINDVLSSTTAGVAGNSLSPSIATAGQVRVDVFAVRDGLTSIQPLSALFTYMFPLVINTAPIVFTSGITATYQMTATGGASGNSWAVDTLPSGVTMSAGGLLTYDGSALTVGTASTFTVTDSLGDTAHAAISVGPSSEDGDPEWALVGSLLHFDGTNESTAFVDQTGKVWTAGGSAVISTTESVFSESGSFPGTDDNSLISTPDDPTLNFGTGDFTIEFFQYYTDISGYQTIATKGYTSAGSWLLQTGNGNGAINVYLNGSFCCADPGEIATETWMHIAVVRSSDELTIYRNGNPVATGAAGQNLSNAYSLGIGEGAAGPVFATYRFKGYMDEFRITKMARYTAAFTPPVAPFVDHA